MANITLTPTDPNTLSQASACLDCIPKGMQGPVMIKLLQDIAGNTMTPNQLMEASACNKCIPSGMQNEVIIFLLDAILAAL